MRLPPVAVEVAAIPWDLREPDPLPEPYRRLAELPRGGVVEFHFPYRSTDLFHHTRYMFDSIWHWQPLINGYSDFIPQDFRDMAIPINGFPDPESFRILREHQARYVVIHLDTYGDASWAYFLFANPKGIQGDSRFASNRGEDDSFDIIYHSEGKVTADGFVIEIGSVDAAAQHLHTIYHDLGNVLGRTA